MRFSFRLSACLLALTVALLAAAPAPPPPSALTANGFLNSADMMRIGVYYYPEAWPESEWDRDMARMHSMGLEFIHVGEFAWARMEPAEGQYHFGWLDRVIALAAKNHLKVILCTPSATPPVWLVREHPEIRMINAEGRPMDFGSRQEADWNSPVYQRYVSQIVTQMAQRYGHNPTVVGWQLDNEMSHYGEAYSYGPPSAAAFRAWLRRRYDSIDALNKAWGAAFWSSTYQNFDQINPPNARTQVAQLNPHAQLDFERWFSQSAAGFAALQTGIIRSHSNGGQWVTTNFMPFYPPVAPEDMAHTLDIIAGDFYPVSGDPGVGPQGFRIGNPVGYSMELDFLRGINGNIGIMELQPGQVNWAPINPQPYPGIIHTWILRDFVAGAKFQCSYRFRQPLFGTEQYHNGFLLTDGVNESSGGKQFAQAAHELEVMRRLRPAHPVAPAAYESRRTAIVYDAGSRWAISNHRQSTRFSYTHTMGLYYAALKSMGAPVDIVGDSASLDRYPVVVLPAHQLVTREQVAHWTQYVQQGGHLIITARTGEMDEHGQFREGPWAEAILPLIGARITGYDDLPNGVNGHARMGTQTASWGAWGEFLQPDAGTSVWARYIDQYYAGTPAIVHRALGKGTVTYVGVVTNKGELESSVLHRVFAEAGLTAEHYPLGLMVDWRGGFWVASNFTALPQTAPIPAGAHIISGGRALPPAGTAVWLAAH